MPKQVADDPIIFGEIALLSEIDNLPALFQSPEAVDKMLGEITARVRSHIPDLTTAKGRDAIKSLARSVASSKVALDNAGKSLTEQLRAQVGQVDAERRRIRDYLDNLRDEARKPVTEWEEAEARRVEALRERYEELLSSLDPNRINGSEEFRAEIERIEAIPIDESWQEIAAQAGQRKDGSLRTLRLMLADAEKREAEQAELARLRKEAEERAEADRKAAAAKAAEERRIAQEKAEQERQAQIEREREEAAARAAEAARQKAEREAEEARRRQEREAAEQIAKVERERQAAEARAQAAERAAAEAVERERAEQDRKRQAEEEAAAKRAADQAHRDRIAGEIMEAIMASFGAAGSRRDAAAGVTAALMEGRIPNVKVLI